MSYFGFATFHDYWLVASQRGYCYEGVSEQESWQRVLDKLKNGAHIQSAEWVRDELKRNPNYRLNTGVWYFEMPEARATIPPDLLAAVDVAMGKS